MPLDQHFPLPFGQNPLCLAERDEVLGSERHVANFIVKDSLQDARAVGVALRQSPVARSR